MNNKRYFLILLAFLTLGLVYYFTQSKSTLEDEFDIALASVEEVDEIELSSGNDAVKLRKIGGLWDINKQGIASKVKIDAFLKVLASLSVRNPVTGSRGQQIKNVLLEEGVWVTCSSNGNKLYKLGFILNPSDMVGSYAFREDHRYAVQLNVVDKEARVFSADPAFWQSKLIFSVASENVKEINVDWGSEAHNFAVRENANLGFDFFRDKSDQTKLADANKLKYYTYEFANLSMNDKNKKYKELAGEWICKVTVTDNNFQKTQALFYQLKNTDGTIDKNNLVVNIANTDVWGKIPYLKVNPCLKKASFFIQS
ncbi:MULTISPECIES: hypothetical protein [unclassified Saccharicrinis]|uniref:hypothetical protein n=1 Tax=unclassified Saccharicrinis TaxID=2646859 RepID=UPI003D34ABAC